MTDILGLPLEKALDVLKQEGAGDITIIRYAAPRAKDTRGTLRVVRAEKDNTVLTVCAFKDHIDMENTDEACLADN